MDADALYSLLDLPSRSFNNLEALDVRLTGRVKSRSTRYALETASNLRKASYVYVYSTNT